MRRIIITEEQAHALSNIIGGNKPSGLPEKAGPYVVNPEKVLLVKKYLDSTFKKGQIENIGADGFPAKVRIAGMMSSNGDILMNIGETQLEDLLIERIAFLQLLFHLLSLLRLRKKGCCLDVYEPCRHFEEFPCKLQILFICLLNV